MKKLICILNLAFWSVALRAADTAGFYDPTAPDERAKADEKINAFLREHAGFILLDDISKAGLKTNEVYMSFPARKAFDIFDTVCINQFAGRISALWFEPSKKYWRSTYTIESVEKFFDPITRAFASQIGLQEDYFERRNAAGLGHDSWRLIKKTNLKDRLNRQKIARKPYPNIDVCVGISECKGDEEPDWRWSPCLHFGLGEKAEMEFRSQRGWKGRIGLGKSEEEKIAEWRTEQCQIAADDVVIAEMNKFYSHGVYIDKGKTNQWDLVTPEIADIHFLSAFKRMTGFEIGQSYVSGVATNVSAKWETQEVDLPVKFGPFKRATLNFKNGRLYCVGMDAPFCEVSRKMEHRSKRIVAADRDGVWNEMNALFGIGDGDVISGNYKIKRCWGWSFSAFPPSKRDGIHLSVGFTVYYQELKGVFDAGISAALFGKRIENLSEEEKKSFREKREEAIAIDKKARGELAQRALVKAGGGIDFQKCQKQVEAMNKLNETIQKQVELLESQRKQLEQLEQIKKQLDSIKKQREERH